jgi:tetratricopeptide (TPR) repeat protein
MYGPAPDLLLGCGLWYALALGVLAIAGEPIRTGGAMSVLPFLVLICSTPHYGATLLRVYRNGEDRRAYRWFTVHATIALFAVFALGVHSAAVGSWILTLYITWSPWHYAGQNYGIAVMFLRRRGVTFDATTRRWLYTSFILSYALTVLALHGGAGEASHFAPIASERVDYRFLSLGIPAGVVAVLLPAVALGYAIATLVAGVRLAKRAPLSDLGPTAVLVLIQALWFSIPLLLRAFEVERSIEPWTSTYGSYYFLWVAIGHAVQYMWITSWYARREGSSSGQLGFLTRAMLAGAAVWTLPSLLFAPGVLGRLPYDGGFALLAAAAVNLHHFVLDGAIWKLRDGRVARILLRDRGSPESAAGDPGLLTRWGGRAVWLAGAACIAIMFLSKWQSDVVIPRAAAAGDLDGTRAAADRLAWVGRDSVKLRRSLATSLRKRRDVEGAIAQYQRSIEIRPNVPSWYDIAELRAGQRRWREASRAYEHALALNPEQATVWYRLGLARLELDEPRAARDAFAQAVALDPGRAIHRTLLERAKLLLSEGHEGAAVPSGPAVPSGVTPSDS